MPFEFKPGAPKPALSIKLAALRGLINDQIKITGAKSVGQNTCKIFTTGSNNYYVEDSKALRLFLHARGFSI